MYKSKKQAKPAAQPQRANTAVSRPISKIPGLEGVTQDMLVIPRLKLIQKISKEVDLGVKPGSLVNSVTKDVVSTDKKPAVVIPILNNITRLYFKPMKEGGGLLCRSFNGKAGAGDPGGNCLACPNHNWDDDNPPICTELLNIFCMVRGYELPIPLTLSFGRTSAKAGRQFVNLFYMQSLQSQRSPWNFAFAIKTEIMSNDKGTFYVLKVDPAGEATAKEIAKGDLFYNLLKISQVQIHEDEEEIKQEAANASAAADDPFNV